MRGPMILLAIVLFGGGAFFLFSGDASSTTDAPEPAPVATAPAAPGAPVEPAMAAVPDLGADLPAMRVFKSPTCGCCGDWVDHLRANGFEVEVVDTNDLMTIKAALGIPPEMSSCHTAEIGDYVVEGHVPAQDIADFLAEAPDARGLAVPGMPVGSPGMEVAGQPADRYDVVTIATDGSTSVYRTHN